jgi:hypothetical protein
MDVDQLISHLLRSQALLHAEIQHLHRRLDAAGYPRDPASGTDDDKTRASRIVPSVGADPASSRAQE